MADYLLKDAYTCPCGGWMLPCAVDLEEDTLTYRCAVCSREETLTSEQSRLEEGQQPVFFRLNNDGDASWKCPQDGRVLDYPLEYLLENFDMSKFPELGCAHCMRPEEFSAEHEGADQYLPLLDKYLSHFTEEQAAELLESLLYEDEEGETPAQSLLNHYRNGLADGEYDDFDSFRGELLDCAGDNFGIEMDEEFNLSEEDW
ncbi:MAG: hypothetical protein E7331_02270 [Clostridiales bacterium]|nr:hypothetical protein [Clostridiales bacterium]